MPRKTEIIHSSMRALAAFASPLSGSLWCLAAERKSSMASNSALAETTNRVRQCQPYRFAAQRSATPEVHNTKQVSGMRSTDLSRAGCE